MRQGCVMPVWEGGVWRRPGYLLLAGRLPCVVTRNRSLAMLKGVAGLRAHGGHACQEGQEKRAGEEKRVLASCAWPMCLQS